MGLGPKRKICGLALGEQPLHLLNLARLRRDVPGSQVNQDPLVDTVEYGFGHLDGSLVVRDHELQGELLGSIPAQPL